MLEGEVEADGVISGAETVESESWLCSMLGMLEVPKFLPQLFCITIEKFCTPLLFGSYSGRIKKEFRINSIIHTS